MAHPPAVTLEITSNGSTVKVYGKRSRAGWTIFRVAGAGAEPVAHQKHKDKAIRAALDCCEPGNPETYHVRPGH